MESPDTIQRALSERGSSNLRRPKSLEASVEVPFNYVGVTSEAVMLKKTYKIATPAVRSTVKSRHQFPQHQRHPHNLAAERLEPSASHK